MKLQQPTRELPPPAKSKQGKYKEVYDKVVRLKPDEWLPVEFPSPHEAYNFRVAASGKRSLQMDVKLRGNFVYLRRRANGSKQKGGK